MTTWQRWLRFGLGVFVILFAAGVYLAIRKPATSVVLKGTAIQWTRGRIAWKLSYESGTEYADGSRRLRKVQVLVSQRGGRDYEITGDEGTTNRDQSVWALKGNVQIKASDGTVIQTDEMSLPGDNVVRAPGLVTIARPRMHGTAVGMTHDQQRDIITLLDQVDMTSEEGEGQPATHITSGGAVWSRPEKTVRYERGATIVRGAHTLQAETITAYMTPDEQTLQMLQLAGNSRITGGDGGSGTLRGMHARDMNLTYAPGGQTLQRAILSGEASVDVASGDRGGTTRISGEYIDLGLDEDGTTLTSLLARGSGPDARAELQLPADANAPPRSVKAVTIQGPAPGARPTPAAPRPSGKKTARPAAGAVGPASRRSGPPRGLTSLRFTEHVEYRETPAAPASPRVARSPQLDLTVQPGFATVDDAWFTGGVRFEQGATLQATSREAKYLMKQGQLELTGVDDKGQLPQVIDEQATIQGKRVVMLPDTRAIQAFEAVQAVFRPARKRADGTALKTPGLFAQDQPAYATADKLDYDGALSRATFRSSGRAKLWQGETTIYGQAIDLDDRTGNLRAKGSVVSTMMLEQTDAKTKRKEKTKTIASADLLDYDDASRRAMYTQGVRMNGAQGHLTSDKATLTLAAQSNGLDRLDAAGHVELRDPGTATTGARVVTGETLTYTAADEKYLVRGKPMKYRDETYETQGDSLTFFRSVDRIAVDGVERTRTQAKSGRKGGSRVPTAWPRFEPTI